MQMLWLMSIALAASACSREVVPCDGHLTAVNAAGAAAIAPARGPGVVEGTRAVDIDHRTEPLAGPAPVPGSAP
jgi:hypothetical protein